MVVYMGTRGTCQWPSAVVRSFFRSQQVECEVFSFSKFMLGLRLGLFGMISLVESNILSDFSSLGVEGRVFCILIVMFVCDLLLFRKQFFPVQEVLEFTVLWYLKENEFNLNHSIFNR